MTTKHLLHLLLTVTIFTLSACGGGGSSTSTTDSTTATDTTTDGTATTTSDGTSISPIALQFPSSLPYSGQVDLAGTSYYLLSGFIPGMEYAITFDNINGSILTQMYAGTTLSSAQICFSNYLTTAGSCIVPASSSGEILITVYNGPIATGSSYRISAALAVEAGEGTPTAPITLSTAASYSSTLSVGTSTTDADHGNSGYYQFTGLTPYNRYIIQLSNLSIGADFYVYQGSYSALACSASSSNTISEFCYITAKTDTLLVRVAADDSGDFTLSATDNGVVAVPAAEGSSGGGEVLLTLEDDILNASVNEDSSYYTVKNLVPGQQYTVGLTMLTDNADLYVYSDSSYTTLACSSQKIEKDDEVCTFTADANSQVWIRVDGSMALMDLGAKYAVLARRTVQSQGSSSAPQIINSNTELPYRLSVDDSNDSYYKITGLSPDTTFLVSMEQYFNSPSVSIYPATGFSSYAACSHNSNHYNHCSGTTNSSGELFLTLQPSYYDVGGHVYMDVKPIPESQGSTTTPLVKNMSTNGNSFDGEVVEDIDSAYEITGLTPNTDYYISVKFDVDDAGAVMYVYNTFTGDLSAETSVCSDSTISIDNGCVATTDANGKLWLVIGGWSAQVGSYYTVAALPVPVSEGTSSVPVDITSSLPYDSTTGSDSESFYMVTGLTANSDYLFALRSRSIDGYPAIYNDSAFSDVVCYGSWYTGRDNRCVGTVSGDTAYIRVNNIGYMSDPGYGSLEVTSVPAVEGTGIAPIEVIGSSHSGSVNVGVSFYKLSLAANTPYTVSLTNVIGDPDLYVSNDPGMSSTVCSSIMGKGYSESCQATSDSNGFLWVAVDGTLSEGGATFLLQAN